MALRMPLAILQLDIRDSQSAQGIQSIHESNMVVRLVCGFVWTDLSVLGQQRIDAQLSIELIRQAPELVHELDQGRARLDRQELLHFPARVRRDFEVNTAFLRYLAKRLRC